MNENGYLYFIQQHFVGEKFNGWMTLNATNSLTEDGAWDNAGIMYRANPKQIRRQTESFRCVKIHYHKIEMV